MNDLLLEVISSKGDISLDEFDRSFNYLFSRLMASNTDIDVRYIKRSIVLSMEELGHCEIDFKNRKLYCCRPTFVLLPGMGIKRAFLAGARTRETIERLRKAQKRLGRDFHIDILPQDLLNIPFPRLVSVEASSIETIYKVAEISETEFHGQTPLSWAIAFITGDIYKYEKELKFESLTTLNWFKRTFDIETLSFNRKEDTKSIVKLIEYTNPVTQQKIHVWEKGGLSAYVDREWGRYLTLKYLNVEVLKYDQNRQLFGVPSYVPLPRMLARAVAMCSGRVAQKIMLKRTFNTERVAPYDLYRGVTNKVAELVARKVGQRLLTDSLNFYGKGEIN